MSGLAGKVVLVTGASSGIGEATARWLAAQGAKVVAGARRVERLKALADSVTKAGGALKYQALDVTSLEDMQRFVAFAEREFGPVDVIVNNAGLMPLAPFAELKIDEWNRMIDVNIRGVLHGIAAVLPGMKQRGRGHVINVSSTASHTVWPTAGVYCATKSAVNAISEGLRQENSDIRVTIVSPGVTESELAETTTHEATASWLKDFRTVALPANAVARAIAYAIEQPAEVDTGEIILRPTKSN
jgi:NADP-dependent 3-hydroxy acid dehydrogenase YdfG